MESYIVRIYRKNTRGNQGPDPLLGYIEQVNTGEKVVFRDLMQLAMGFETLLGIESEMSDKTLEV